MIKKILFMFLLLSVCSGIFAQNPFIAPADKQQEKAVSEKAPESKPNWLLSKIINFQKDLNKKLSSGLEKLKKEENFSLFLLLFSLSFIYGIIHAIGPGHGKAILANWIVASPKKWKKITITSVSAAFAHALSSVILVFASWFILNQLVSMESEAIQSYLKIAAGGILILLGVYSIIHFILHKTRHSHHNVPEKKEIKSLWIIISVGMIPCPISSLILIFSLTLGLYWYGILFVFAFAAGMAITLLGISLAVHMLREKVFNLKLKKVEWILYNAVPIMAALFFLFAGFSLISPLLV